MRWLIVVMLVVVCLQIVLWLVVGQRDLYRTVPRMIEMDLAVAREATGRSQPDDDAPRPTLVVCEDLARSIGMRGLAQLREQLGPVGCDVVDEASAPAGWRGPTHTRPEFVQLCAGTAWSTPLVADVEIVLWQGGLAAEGQRHRAWFLLGWWFPAPAHSVWVS